MADQTQKLKYILGITYGRTRSFLKQNFKRVCWASIFLYWHKTKSMGI